MLEKKINISEQLAKKIEQAIITIPGLDFNIIINQALNQWLKKSPQEKFDPELLKRFIKDNSKGNGPIA